MTSSNDLQSLLRRIEKAAARLEELSAERAEKQSAPASGAAAAAAADDKATREYETTVLPLVTRLVECSDKIGGVVGEQARAVQRLAVAQHGFIALAARTKKPSAAQLARLLEAQQAEIQQAIRLKDSNRPSEYFDNLSAVAECVPAFGWVVVDQTPVPYVIDAKESAEFYTNRVLKKWREKDPNHAEWVKALLSLLRELAAYVKQFYTTGLTWNPKGSEVEAVLSAAPAATPAVAAGAPALPPPPPLMPSSAQLEERGQVDSGSEAPGTRGALFAELNKGGGVTSGLRKVEKDQMTHKNPALRASGTVKADDSSSSTPAKAPAGVSSKADRPPRMELVNDKWVVENYGTEHLTIEVTKTKETVYMYNCKGTTLDIKNKLNSIAIDSCQKCGVVFDTLVSQCEIVNSKSVQVQTRETVPSILIDRTDGAHIFLSEDARDVTQITTAKASEVNVSFPFTTDRLDDDNFVEHPIPEQLQSVVKNGKLVTTVLEHTG
ncbi:suppressor of rasval19 [Coemansia biformis]|uniref:Adenylyl cyclase-associated protein n=1 Tax=Coemansia biformis TaxID=1286918 RepID=A0A9W7YCJ2_9FUNG|nr:suppressor of rasval19 [Coemansia biformis]